MERLGKLLAVLGVVVIGAVAYYATRESKVKQSPVITQECVDLATGEDVTIRRDVHDRAPFVNPETGERTVYPWYFDENAGKRFVPNLVLNADGPPTLPLMPINPATGNAGTQWVRELFQDEYLGDEELPKLPAK